MSTWKNPQLRRAAGELQAQSEVIAKRAPDSKGAPVIASTSSDAIRLSKYQSPGRLGNPQMEIGTDPRLDARLRPLLAGFGVDKAFLHPETVQLGSEPSLEAIGAMIGGIEAGSLQSFKAISESAKKAGDPESAIEREDRVIAGGDGQEMLVHIYRSMPKSTDHSQAKGPLPAVIYIHGGAMVMFSASNPMADGWCRSLAAAGDIVVISIDFRSAYVAGVHHPFPAGLNDCAAATRWVASNREELGIGKFIVTGESGGANLAIATAIKANREGWVNEIAGVWASVPYISNGYGWSREQQLELLPSLVECDNYFGMNVMQQSYHAHYYSPQEEDQRNPLAWPYHATADDLRGLPPHLVVMDELDALRSEGEAYARNLTAAGVDVDARILLGGPHATSLTLRQSVPERGRAAVRDVVGFAKSR